MRKVALILFVFLAACKEDPAKSVKIVARPAEPASVPAAVPASLPPAPASKPTPLKAAAAPKPTSVVTSNLEFCPPPSESSGPSDLTVTGECAFQQKSAVSCEATADDLILATTRKAKQDATVVVYLNVEHYHGPGNYDDAQMFIAVQGGTTIYRWSNDNVKVTVGPDVAFVTFPETRLEGEPMLVDCSKLISAETNYLYQCVGRNSTGKVVVERTAEVVSGRLQCLKKTD